MNKKISKVLTSIILFAGIAFTGIVSFVTLFLTVDDSTYRDSSMVIKFTPLVILGLILFIGLLVSPLLDKIKKIKYTVLARFVFCYGLILSLIWIVVANVLPMWDSESVVNAAKFLDGDRSAEAIIPWTEGDYLQRFPHQTPLIIFFFICIKIAGVNAVLFFEVLNCIACAVTMYLIIKYTYALTKNNSAANVASILTIFFLPLMLYCTFIYGDIICLPFVLGCLYFQKLALDAKNVGKKYLVLSFIFGIVATLLKPSMILISIAVGVVYAIHSIQIRKFSLAIFAIIFILVAKFSILPINTILESKIHTNLHDGMGSMAWVTMGIGGGKEYKADNIDDESLRESTDMAGYFDEFLWALPNSEYSKEKMGTLSSEYLKKRFNHYKTNPGLALSFFSTKFVIEWGEPLFESLLVSNWDTPDPSAYSMRDRELSPVASSVYYGKLNRIIVYICDCMQTILPLGFLIALLSLRKKIKISQLAPLIYILGVFVLYLFWESKTEYFLTPYLLMIPFAGIGWNATSDYLGGKLGQAARQMHDRLKR